MTTRANKPHNLSASDAGPPLVAYVPARDLRIRAKSSSMGASGKHPGRSNVRPAMVHSVTFLEALTQMVFLYTKSVFWAQTMMRTRRVSDTVGEDDLLNLVTKGILDDCAKLTNLLKDLEEVRVAQP
ncbi:hypothetical protein BT96DRAFT_1005167 [Gymnopus androsaceus JB14]|uniref:Uncharacterized protein n=1 Tax=Gymnopus androsaceus JB14 TaxID=1447944 RepID=A0A6A4GPP2_9AGAR|nr:hypothetical protein BT96DRAFT_1005167 [Gymnopus androsaceus JB14]